MAVPVFVRVLIAFRGVLVIETRSPRFFRFERMCNFPCRHEICEKCGAVFNKFSVLTERDGNQIWKCEFCAHENEVMIGEEEMPATPELTYLLEAPQN